MFQLRCFSFFLNFLCSFSWMTYSSLPFLCVILVAQNGKDCCVSPQRSPAAEMQLVRDLCTRWATATLFEALKRSCISTRQTCPQFIKHAVTLLGWQQCRNREWCYPEHCLLSILYPENTGYFYQASEVTERTMISWSNSAILQHNKGQKLQRNNQSVGGPSLWYVKVTLKN